MMTDFSGWVWCGVHSFRYADVRVGLSGLLLRQSSRLQERFNNHLLQMFMQHSHVPLGHSANIRICLVYQHFLLTRKFIFFYTLCKLCGMWRVYCRQGKAF